MPSERLALLGELGRPPTRNENRSEAHPFPENASDLHPTANAAKEST